MTDEDKKEPLYKYVKDYYWNKFHFNTATVLLNLSKLINR